MLKSNKLTSESALTTNRPTSRIDTSYLNRGYSQHTQRQSTNKKLWIKINKVTEDVTDSKPYIAIEKQRNTNSCHIKPSLIRKTSSDVKNQIDLNEIKNFIKEIDHNYGDEPFIQKANQKQTLQYQNEKRLNHLNLILASFRDRIKNRNIQYKIEFVRFQSQLLYQMTQNLIINKVFIQFDEYKNLKIKLIQDQNRLQQLSIQLINLRQQSDKQIGFKISQLKQQNVSQHLIYNNYLKSYRTSSDYILNQIPNLPSQQISKLTEELGNLDNYNLTSDRLENSKEYCGKPQSAIKRILRRNKKNLNKLEDELLGDESIISETEAKLNSLYGESISIQKNLLQNQKTNPIKIINSIKKIDQIKSIINKVNANKLMNKFII